MTGLAVVTGADDTTVSPSCLSLLVPGITGARQVVIPNSGQDVSVDQAEQFNQALVEFLL